MGRPHAGRDVAVPIADQDRSAAGRMAGGDVAPAIAHKPAPVERDGAIGGGGENHVRIAYCKGYEEIEIAMGRIRKFLEKF